MAAGDVDGDGFDDLFIGAPRSTFGSGRFAGGVFVYFGGADGIDVNARPIGLVPPDIQRQDVFGAAVGGGDDLNGDGLEDIVVGVPGDDDWDAGEDDVGAVWVAGWSPDKGCGCVTQGPGGSLAWAAVFLAFAVRRSSG